MAFAIAAAERERLQNRSRDAFALAKPPAGHSRQVILRHPFNVLIAAIVFGLAGLSQASDQLGSRDPAFAKVPFDQWFNNAAQTRMKWTAHISRPDLSVHQRLITNVEVYVDGAELARRSGKGQFVMFVQFTDERE